MPATPEQKRAHYRKNRERILAIRKKHYQNNREQVIKKTIEYRKTHREEVCENNSRELRVNGMYMGMVGMTRKQREKFQKELDEWRDSATTINETPNTHYEQK